MKYCESCKVNIRGKETECPLCQKKLSGESQEEVYPVVPTVYKQFNYSFKMLILFTVAGCAACVAVNMIIPSSGYWSVFVLLGNLSFWITLAYAVRKKDNIAKDTTIWILIVSALSFVWDWSIGWHGWSLNFAFPIACGMAIASITILSKLIKLRGEDYIIYLVVNDILGFVPIILCAAGLADYILPSAICMALAIVSLTVLILFEGKNVLDEIRKTFHL